MERWLSAFALPEPKWSSAEEAETRCSEEWRSLADAAHSSNTAATTASIARAQVSIPDARTSNSRQKRPRGPGGSDLSRANY